MRSLQGTFTPLARAKPPLVLARSFQGRRPFHRTSPASFHVASPGDAVAWTAEAISSLHTFGLPWLLTLPLVAVGFNFSLRLPVQFYCRRLAFGRAQLNPLLTAWGARHMRETFGTYSSNDKLAKFQALRRLENSRRRIYKTWGVQRWKTLASVFTITPFIVVTEALRRLCDAPIGWIGQLIMPAGADSAATKAALFDETLAEGGILWIEDLTQADPYYALPLLCSAILARNAWGRLTMDQLKGLLAGNTSAGLITPTTRIQTFLGRMVLFVPFLPVLVGDLPSAIFVFWATTFSLSEINESILRRNIPKPTPEFPRPQAPSAIIGLPFLRENLPIPKPGSND